MAIAAEVVKKGSIKKKKKNTSSESPNVRKSFNPSSVTRKSVMFFLSVF